MNEYLYVMIVVQSLKYENYPGVLCSNNICEEEQREKNK